MSRRAQMLALLVVVALASVLRVYRLKDVPAGLFCDEADLGYNAYCLGTAGMDENGVRFPLFIWSFGVSYKNPVYIYTTALPVRLFGLDEFTTRLPAALYGVGTVIALFFLGRALFNPWVGLFAAILLAVCPWHLHFSRIAFELISFPFLFVTGLVFLVRYTQGRRTLAAGLFFCSSCIYAYAVAYLFVPLFLTGFGLLYLPTMVRRWRETILALLVLGATVSPAALFLYRHQQTGTQYFRNTTNLAETVNLREQGERLLHNYQEFFSRVFLFESGDPIVRHSVRGFGELLPVYAPFLLLGAVVCLFWRDRATKVVLWWLALYPLAPSLMTEIPSASRGIIGAPAFCLLAAIGLAAALKALAWIAHWRPLALAAQTAAIAVTAYFLVPQVTRYLQAYFVDYPKYSAPTYGGFQYGYRDAIHYMESQRSNYDLLMLTATDVNQPQVFPLFYNHVDPRDWLKRHDLGYLILDPSEYARYSVKQRVLYALRPSNLDMFTDYTVKKEIVAPGGQVEFVIAEVRARKHFLAHWLGLGLFDNEAKAGVARNFIDSQNLPRGPVAGAFGNVEWTRIAQQFVRVDLNVTYARSHPRYLGNPEWVCAYAVTTVRSETARTGFLELAGSDDSAQVWLNGQSLTTWPLLLGDDPKRRPIELNAGDNELLVKSCETIGSWYFSARVVDDKGVDLPGVTTAAEIPATVPGPARSAPQELPQLVDGFGAIVRFKTDYHQYPDYRGAGAQAWSVAVRDQGTDLVWQSAPCPEQKPTVVAFHASTSDEQGDFDLYVNGTHALTFHVGPGSDMRSASQGDYALTFVPKAHVAGNSGIALLSVPAAQITPGQPIEIRVVPKSGDPAAWFMVQSYPDTIAIEQLTPEQASEAVHSPWSD